MLLFIAIYWALGSIKFYLFLPNVRQWKKSCTRQYRQSDGVKLALPHLFFSAENMAGNIRKPCPVSSGKALH